MKKTMISLLVVSLFLFSSCQQIQDRVKSTIYQSEDTTSETQTDYPSEVTATATDATINSGVSSFAYTKKVQIADGVLTLRIPTDFTQEFAIPGSLFVTSGLLTNSDGEESVCQLSVTHVFREEEPMMDYEMFDSLAEYMIMLNLSSDYEFERIKDVKVSHQAKGFYSHYAFTYSGDDYDRYIFFIGSTGVYYGITFLCDQEAFSQDEILEIFDSLEINSEKEADWVDRFSLQVENGWYNSDVLDGAKVKLTDTVTCTESMRIPFVNAILGVTLNTNAGSLHILAYPKQIYTYENYNDFINGMITNIIDRGFFESDNPDADIVQTITGVPPLFGPKTMLVNF